MTTYPCCRSACRWDSRRLSRQLGRSHIRNELGRVSCFDRPSPRAVTRPENGIGMIGRSEDVRHDVLLGHDARAMDHLMPGLVLLASEGRYQLDTGKRFFARGGPILFRGELIHV